MNRELTIQQAAAETSLSGHTLRYYERIGLILDIARAQSGHRRYKADDLEWINFLKQLKATGMPLAQMQRFAQLRREGVFTTRQRREMLEQHRQSILDQVNALNKSLAMVDTKIARHRKSEENMRESD